jgi:hypothetical protein
MSFQRQYWVASDSRRCRECGVLLEKRYNRRQVLCGPECAKARKLRLQVQRRLSGQCEMKHNKPDLLARLAVLAQVSRAALARRRQRYFATKTIVEATGVEREDVLYCGLSLLDVRLLALLAKLNRRAARETLEQVRSAASASEARRIFRALIPFPSSVVKRKYQRRFGEDGGGGSFL